MQHLCHIDEYRLESIPKFTSKIIENKIATGYETDYSRICAEQKSEHNVNCYRSYLSGMSGETQYPEG